MKVLVTNDDKLKIIAHESEAKQLRKWLELINLNAVFAQLVTYVGQGTSELIISQSESDEMVEWKKSKPTTK